MKVSILIPAYNSARYLDQTLQSALNQTWLEKEVVVVDDGSTDNSAAIAIEYAEKGLIKFFQQPNGGACKARNRAFAESTGEYIQYLDADDLLAPDKIAIQMRRMDGGNSEICNGRWGRFYSNEPFREEIKWGPHKSLQRDLNPIDWLCQSHMSATHCWLIPRELILKAGKWDETLTQNQDGDFFTRVVANSKMVYYTEAANAYYRSNLDNSVSRQRNLDANARSRFKSCESFEKMLLNLEDSARTRLAVSNHYQQFIYSAFPYYRDLVKKAEEKVVRYGGSNWPPDNGGRWAALLTTLFGWKSVRVLKKMIQ